VCWMGPKDGGIGRDELPHPKKDPGARIQEPGGFSVYSVVRSRKQIRFGDPILRMQPTSKPTG
jgi:hypothetical protein